MPVMKSLRAFRLASTTGHIIQVQADTPVFIPDRIYADALAAGMVPTGDPDPAPNVPEPVAVTPPPAPEPEPEPEIDREDAIRTALLVLIARNDESDFKTDGTPKVNKVNAELPIEVDRATATEISDMHAELQGDVSLADAG